MSQACNLLRIPPTGNNGGHELVAWLCVGEWGGQDIDSAGKTDATWHTAFVAYMQQLGATDQFYW